ncbi:hypothetical protein [Novosphingobium sp. AP12]|uniref:hypothetical protein n=1 Tax=Novosphingobium sp. AP12 TaxID=1144305 RepID=UPI000271F10C|nr:hypothetical protein [Novosphingobium sp. AP12]EJL34272.1 glutathione S-transferase-like protein [Novosphingobium sp. AP12]
MADYDFYYWPLPFRGQFIRAILAYAGKDWTENDSGAIAKLMEKEPRDQPVPFMGPPVLVDTASGFALSQMPAIALYLGDTLGLMPDSAEGRAVTAKIVNDANDVIDEITLDGGREMWTAETWEEFVPRLRRWMGFWEAIAAKRGLTAGDGFLLGTDEAGVADIVTAVLWTTMADRFASIAKMLEQTAPLTSALAKRMHEVPALAALKAKAFEQYGDGYCGGEIEKSLRAVAN